MWEVIKKELLQIKYIPPMDNIADIFTKPLPTMHFRMLRDKMVSDLQGFIENGAVSMAKLLLIMKGLESRYNTSMAIKW